MGAMTLALTMGGLSALSSIASTSQQNRQAQYNKKMAEAQAPPHATRPMSRRRKAVSRPRTLTASVTP